MIDSQTLHIDPVFYGLLGMPGAVPPDSTAPFPVLNGTGLVQNAYLQIQAWQTGGQCPARTFQTVNGAFDPQDLSRGPDSILTALYPGSAVSQFVATLGASPDQYSADSQAVRNHLQAQRQADLVGSLRRDLVSRNRSRIQHCAAYLSKAKMETDPGGPVVADLFAAGSSLYQISNSPPAQT